jgi:hypothetical protein
MKIEWFDIFFVKFSNIRFNQNQFILSRAVLCVGQTDGEILVGVSQGCKRAKK